MRRGILGGTFDPPHVAHLVAGEAAYRALRLDVVTFLPAGAPWQKADPGFTAATHRLEMTRLATADVSYFEVDDREVRRDGWTYTIDTLATFVPSDDVVLILGADAAASIPSWHRAEDLLATTRLAIVPRPGIARSDVEDAVGNANTVWVEMPDLAVSSTDLRRRIAAGHSVRFLVPDPVLRFIDAEGLYRPA